jgi:DNA mismatch repair protein MutL
VFPKNGTIFEVRDLFYNVPVRLKFLRGDITENNYCVDVFKRIAMAKAMNEHFLNNYTPLHWWQDIFKWAKQ